jgi:guanylate kinase
MTAADASVGTADGGGGEVFRRRGVCLILSSPSGAGKTTLAKALLAAEPETVLSVSATTREPRPGEQDGVDYVFVSRARFRDMERDKELLEWAEVFGNLYGTPALPLLAHLDSGIDVVCDVDWQGARSISAAIPHDAVRIFILPPSRAELERRLRLRASDSEAVIARRLAGASEEMSHWYEYDYVIVHRAVDTSLATLRAILSAERVKRHRQPDLGPFVGRLSCDR